MSILSNNKLIKLNAMGPQGGFWYITKQNLIFRDLCFMAKLLDAWNDNQEENFQTFFDRHKTLPEYGELPPLTAHRATKNCEYLGLTKASNKYSAQSLTPYYFSLKELCKGDFDKLSSYPQIINKQLERIFIDSTLYSTYTKPFKICPFMFLFKILLLIGDITNLYKITTSEFKLFVATAQSWNDYFEVVESIMRYRNDNSYKTECDANNFKVSDVRYNVLSQNHSQLEVTSNEIAIKDGEVKEIRRKVSEFELSDKIQSAEYMYSAEFISTDPLQQIFYGAPGTGKSHCIKDDSAVKEAESKNLVFRTTFHPDSDYSTFVGAYKPTSIEVPVMTIIGKEQMPVVNAQPEKKITYSFVPQAFLQAYVAAWNNPDDKVFLVIEEINRGNCAQIFGDLFQLLDRDENGCSEYPIMADKDLSKYLNGNNEEGQPVLNNKDGIKDGKLCLPRNLYIWATMNTSDQSLFPIDSAFKRRWDWKYMPIENAEKNWKIEVNNHEYDWYRFLTEINTEVFNLTHSEDKQLGYFFAKAKGGKIDANTLVNKVYFYLWTDVFKDYEFESLKAFKKADGKDAITFKDFFQKGKIDEVMAEQVLINLELNKTKENEA